ncbi:hypothetical protein HAX54_034133, partial [Datura stramonium]|nr:hypothetical protein [Datura stramonium]
MVRWSFAGEESEGRYFSDGGEEGIGGCGCSPVDSGDVGGREGDDWAAVLEREENPAALRRCCLRRREGGEAAQGFGEVFTGNYGGLEGKEERRKRGAKGGSGFWVLRLGS